MVNPIINLQLGMAYYRSSLVKLGMVYCFGGYRVWFYHLIILPFSLPVVVRTCQIQESWTIQTIQKKWSQTWGTYFLQCRVNLKTHQLWGSKIRYCQPLNNSTLIITAIGVPFYLPNNVSENLQKLYPPIKQPRGIWLRLGWSYSKIAIEEWRKSWWALNGPKCLGFSPIFSDKTYLKPLTKELVPRHMQLCRGARCSSLCGMYPLPISKSAKENHR